MARIRTIKPEFFTDEVVGECSPTTRLLFVACWVFADDNGNLERSAKQLKAQAFPYDSLDCEPMLAELIERGLLIEYEADGKKCLHISGFDRHQRIEKPSKPRLPLYIESPTSPGALPEPSPTTPGVVGSLREGKGRERKGEGTRKRATSLPESLTLTEQHRQYAEAQGLVGPAEQFERFLDHHRAKGSVFVDWDAAWRTWVRNGVGFQAKDRGSQRRVDRRAD
jgi:hypothetical protein